MITEKQLEANRQNALQTIGPKTGDGIEAVKMNALRHGLRSVQTVGPEEDKIPTLGRPIAPPWWKTQRRSVRSSWP
jgi:hypothetical protein